MKYDFPVIVSTHRTQNMIEKGVTFHRMLS